MTAEARTARTFRIRPPVTGEIMTVDIITNCTPGKLSVPDRTQGFESFTGVFAAAITAVYCE
jgi:hypothetical protein